MLNYPIQWDLIGINGKIRFSRTEKYKNNCLLYLIPYTLINNDLAVTTFKITN